VNLSCTILSHPQRQARAVALAGRLLSLHPSVMVDRTRTAGNLQAAMLAWAEHGSTGYHLVIQDDALPATGFITSARAAVEVAEGAAVAFWMRPWLPEATLHKRAGWGTLVPLSVEYHWPPTVALALPCELITSLLDHQWRCHPDARYDDDVIGCWMAEQELELRVCSPSICDHDEAMASILNGQRRPHPYRQRTHLAERAPTEWRLV